MVSGNIEIMHARELITMDVYGDNGNIIAEEIPPELLSYDKSGRTEKGNRAEGHQR